MKQFTATSPITPGSGRQWSRRAFVGSLAAASTLAAPSDRIHHAVIGLGGRGAVHLKEFARQPGCRVVAVCDVDQQALDRGAALIESLQSSRPKTYTDLRRVFEDGEIDTVSIATPNHWHALATIWACQAGKDVYVEKPASHNIWEGRQMIEAARKYERLVQVGSQSRSIAHKIRAMRLLQEGIVGKVYLAKGLCYKRRRSIGHTPETPVPAGLDWNVFLGPAPTRPFTRNRFHYNWHWFWDTGNGDIGNQGVHEMDLARWGLNRDSLPKSVVSTGAKFVYDDDQETPNTQTATFDYGDAQLVFEVRGLLTNAEEGILIGNIFYGADGYMTVDSQGFAVYKGEKKEKVMTGSPEEGAEWDVSGHIANFLQAVRSRRRQDLTADVAVGVTSAALCHLANISYRLRRMLTFDSDRWEFPGDSQANRLLTRDYRAPFVVPEKV